MAAIIVIPTSVGGIVLCVCAGAQELPRAEQRIPPHLVAAVGLVSQNRKSSIEKKSLDDHQPATNCFVYLCLIFISTLILVLCLLLVLCVFFQGAESSVLLWFCG